MSAPLWGKSRPAAPRLGTDGGPSQGTMARAQTEDLAPSCVSSKGASTNECGFVTPTKYPTDGNI